MLESTRLRPNPTHIFECFVKVLPPKNGEIPEMHLIYPPNYEWDEETKRNLPKFCYPCENYSPPISQHFTFVLTDLESKYRFGHCVYPPGGGRCYCFFSHLPWHEFFYQLLNKLEDIGFYQKEAIHGLLDEVYHNSACKTWYKGGETTVTLSMKGVKTSDTEDYVLHIPDPTRLPSLPGNHNLNTFYTNLSHNVLLAILASLVFERRILMTAKSIETLTGCVHGASMVLYPLYWQHIFCPVLPPHLMDYCCAPMPFLIGVHSSLMEKVQKMPLGDIVTIDIDAQTLESPYDDLGQFPEDVVSALKHTLKKPSSATGETVARAFVSTFAVLIGQYKSAFAVQTTEKKVDGKIEKKKEFVFDPDMFIRVRPQMSNVLEHLLHFQHFQQFISARLASANSDSRVVYRDLFDDEVQALEDEWRNNWKKNPEAMKRALVKNNTRLKEQSKKLGGQIKVGYQKLKKNLEGLSTSEEVSSLRHNVESLDLDAIVIKAKIQRGTPPKPPKPYAKHREEKRPSCPTYLPVMTEEDERSDHISDTNLISLTPPHSMTQWPKAPNNGVDSSDSDSLISTSSSSSDGGVIILPPPPVPPPRPNRRRVVISSNPSSQRNESSDVIGNLPVIADATRREILAKDTKRESLDFSSSLAAALIDIDPHTAESLQHHKTGHPSPFMPDLPSPLVPVKTVPTDVQPVVSSNNTKTSHPPMFFDTDIDSGGVMGKTQRSNAISRPVPSTSNPVISNRAGNQSPFADLLTNEWLMKKPVGTGSDQPTNGK